jgi:archaellum biogenesis protein FlaJ (TadC family)
MKYYVGILISFIPFGNHLVGEFFLLLLLVMLRFSTILLCIVDESVKMNNVFFLVQFIILRGMLESIRGLHG